MADRFEHQRLGNEHAVYDRETGAVHMLNATAWRIWCGVREGLDSESILRELSAVYRNVDQETLAADMRQALSSLKAAGLLSGETPDARRERPHHG